MGLLAAGIAVGVGLLAGSEERRFERLAANEIASRLQGENRRVAVNVRPAGIGGLWGELESATITAQDFSLDELPLFTEPDRSTAG